jgi:hypothetical protein
MTVRSKYESVRLTIDFPIDQHTYIKTLAAAEGLSLRQFVIEHLPSPEKKKRKAKTTPSWENITPEMAEWAEAIVKRVLQAA